MNRQRRSTRHGETISRPSSGSWPTGVARCSPPVTTKISYEVAHTACSRWQEGACDGRATSATALEQDLQTEVVDSADNVAPKVPSMTCSLQRTPFYSAGYTLTICAVLIVPCPGSQFAELRTKPPL